MKKSIKHILFDSQVEDSKLAKREQAAVAIAILFFTLAVFTVHALTQDS